MRTCTVLLLLLVVCVGLSVAPAPRGREEAKAKDEMYNTEGLSSKDAQDQEYFRYISQIVGELEKDETFRKMTENITEEDVSSGKLADLLDHVGHDVRKKIDEVKRMEVEYQRDLIRQNKHKHMEDISTAYWNPVHHYNTETFEKDDLRELLQRHSKVINEVEIKRHQEFKRHELQKEHERREAMAKMTEEERLKAVEMRKQRVSSHEVIHEPGHKAQLEEVWDKSDGFDPDNFNPRTFFFLHDKNADGYLDYYESETFFLHDLDKLYNTSDPNVDLWERQEELERMRVHMLEVMDTDKDGLISLDEFVKVTSENEWVEDKEWKSVGEDEQLFTEKEYEEYEKLLQEVREETKKAAEEKKGAGTSPEETAKNT